MLAILLLAAGRSSRMGDRDKLLEEVDGAPLLRTMANRALTTGAQVHVVLATDRPARTKALNNVPVTLTEARDAHLGMAHSLRAGIAALPATTSAAMILPADMPEITAGDMATMTAAHQVSPGRILRATSASGKPGHPVVFPAAFFPDLTSLSGDHGARPVLATHSDTVSLVPLPHDHALTDLDTPADWAAWRATRGETPKSR